ncbi:MAG TPA: alpha/beta hydrolase [Caulobacteraceae bacterium]|jgi:pimeloyl-ACP methyl ester carboxylesterase|nr:alpha/beta hydrolase [Caulobacteraceae bacterium]
MTESLLPTRFADIAVRDSGGDGPVVLMIHGNSSCKTIFRHQFESALAERLRLVAMDLPGHGASGDARDPARAYTLNGYADAAVEVLERLGLARPAVLGWSLGGHVALNMISRLPDLAGVMISGTPPVPGTMEGFGQGFQQNAHMALAGSDSWAEGDAEAYARATAGSSAAFEPFMLEAARRTHNIARSTFFADALAGEADDQRHIAETAKVPLAIVNGADDAFINAAYFDTVAYANLWDGRVFSLAGVGHAPFWEAPGLFNPLLERFAAETAA